MGYTWQEESLWKVQETESQLGQLLGAVMGFDTAQVIYLDECRRLQPLLWGVANVEGGRQPVAPASCVWEAQVKKSQNQHERDLSELLQKREEPSHQETEFMTNLRFLKRERLWDFPRAQLT